MLLDYERVIQILPHRKPFLFIDTVESITPPEGFENHPDLTPKDLIGTEVRARFEVREEMDILKGHFPGNPIVPGVVQAEMMAQASTFLILPLFDYDVNRFSVETLLLGVDGAKFRKPITPGDHLTIISKLEKARGEVANYDCAIFIGEEKISQAKILAKLMVKKG